MKSKFASKTLPLYFLIVTLMLSAVQPVMAEQTAPQTTIGPNVVYDPATGALAFIGSDAGQPLSAPPASLTAEMVTQSTESFISAYAGEMGLHDTSELVPTKSVQGFAGRRSVRYHQAYQGIPVFASDVFVNLTARGTVSSLTAKVSPDLQIDTHPTLTAAKAKTGALAAVATYYKMDAADLTASAPELQIYDSRLLGLDTAAQLVWKMVVSSWRRPVEEIVLIDAQDGSVALQYSQIDTGDLANTKAGQPSDNLALVSAHVQKPGIVHSLLGTPLLSIYDLAGTAPDPMNALAWDQPSQFVCDQSTPCNSSADADIVNTTLNIQEFYNFFVAHHNRDSFDGLGSRTNAHVRFAPSGNNVFWIALPVNSLVSSPGMPVADDLAGHALTFGFTASTSNLVLAYQPGAISESLADMWGEFIDQNNGRGNDSTSVAWLIGEDAPGGASRSMKSPPSVGNPGSPDKMSSSLYYTKTSDHGGIHYNAGINNKAVYLMTVGGPFNGQAIRGLGMEKVIDIYYEAETQLLVSASTYFDLYYALQQACTNLVGVDGGNGAIITTDDCNQVTKAINAVEMNKSAKIVPVAAFCPANTKGRDLFLEGFEGSLSNWSLYNLAGGSSQWTLTNSESPEGLNHLHGPEPTTVSEPVAQMLTPIFLPAKRTSTFLYFRHRMDFETTTSAGKSTYFDGGVLQYSLNGSDPWKSAASFFSGGLGYTGTINSAHSNPLKGQSAFVGLKGDYVSSRYNISSLAGHNVWFRWVVGTDNQSAGTGNGGWDLDAVRIYNCVVATSKPVLVAPANGTLMASNPLLDWTDSAPDLDHYQLQVALSGAFSPTVIDTSVFASQYKVPALDPNRKYFWRVQAWNPASKGSGWSAVRTFVVGLAKPALVLPANGAILKTARPNFDWSDSVNAPKYTIQISRVGNFSVILATAIVTTSSFTPTKPLPPLTNLYWRVKATGKYPSAWSQVRHFKTGNPPSLPALVSPTNGSNANTTPTLSWTKVTLPTGTVFGHYQVQVDDNSDFSSPVVDDSSITSISMLNYLVGTPLTSGTQYYWRVQAWTSAGNFSNWSDAWTFVAQ